MLTLLAALALASPEPAAREFSAPIAEVVPLTRPDVRTSQRSPFGIRLLLYIPNRFLDVFDMARLRLRLGPGFAISVRATEAADAFLGAYAAIYAGLPGPRNRPMPKLPVGIESKAGAELSLLDLSSDLWLVDPDYGDFELGVGVHAAIVGVDVGVDPMEILDFIGGFVFWDPARDDL